MSEQSSLYVKVKIDEKKLQQFFQQQPTVQPLDANWLTWWDSREMYSKKELSNIPVYRVENHREIFKKLLNDRNLGCSEEYDLSSHTWTFISVFFSENYVEILPMLTLLKELASHQDSEDVGVALLYDHLWGSDDLMVYMEFSNQQALLKDYKDTTEVDPAILYVANQALEKAVEIFNKQFEG